MTQTILEHYKLILDKIYNKLYDARDVLDDIIYDISREKVQLEYLSKEQLMKSKIKLPVKKSESKKMESKACDKSMPMAKKKK